MYLFGAEFVLIIDMILHIYSVLSYHIGEITVKVGFRKVWLY